MAIESNPMPPPSTLTAALRTCALVAAALLTLPTFAATPEAAKPAAKPAPARKVAQPKAAAVPVTKSKPASTKAGSKTAAKKDTAPQGPCPLADFGQQSAPDDVVHVANWVSYTHNNQKKAFVLIDKKQARLYVFDPQGKLKSHTQVLLGKAIGDDATPGIGSKPISQMTEAEKTTPAGRFLAQPGRNTHGEDIIWIDYNTAISMHRLRMVSAEQQRAYRMETPDVSDNRISYGCVNIPPKFYTSVLRPTVGKYGAFVYVLPETRTAQKQFGSYDVTANKVSAR